MILSSTPPLLAPEGGVALAVAAALLYLVAALPAPALQRFCAPAWLVAWLLHLLLLVADVGGLGQPEHGMRLGFAPVLSMTVWLLIAVHTIESRFVPLPGVRRALGVAGALAVLTALLFPGAVRPIEHELAPLHYALGVASYALFAAAVLHALMLDAAERRLRAGASAAAAAGPALGLPLLQLERITFRFVEAGFGVLTATMILGASDVERWHWDHKWVFSALAWCVFAALLVGRHLRGWRGRRATRWLYIGAVLLLLSYAGSRFVFEVLLGRPPT